MTLILAKTYGIYFLFVGLGLLKSPDRFRSWYETILAEDRRQLFGGLFSLLIGAFILSVHNHLVADWRVVLTLIGYWGVFAGAGCFLSKNFVAYFKPMINSSDTVYRFSGFVWFLLGVFLTYKGYA